MNYKTKLEQRPNNQLVLITEINDINVVDHLGKDLGKCDLVEIWHNDGDINLPSYYVMKSKDDDSYLSSGNDITFSLIMIQLNLIGIQNECFKTI